MNPICKVVQELQWCDVSGAKPLMATDGPRGHHGPYRYWFTVYPDWLPTGVHLAVHLKAHSGNWWAATHLAVRVRRRGDIKAKDPRLENPESFQQLKDWAIMAANLTQG